MKGQARDGELSLDHKRAWVAFFVSHGTLVRKIDRMMQEEGVLPMDVYDVLLHLEEAPERRLRMSDLADRVLLSRSGITRLVDRLERDGLLRRENCTKDRRTCWAVLTDKGFEERERAWPVYRKAISEVFASNMTEAEARTVAAILRRSIDVSSPFLSRLFGSL